MEETAKIETMETIEHINKVPCISNEISKRITSLRFILIVLVIFIHNNYTAESITGTNIVFNQSTFGKYLQLFISNGIANCAVPVFFIISSYLQFLKDVSYANLIKKKAKSLFVPLILWPILNILGFIVLKMISEKIFPSLIDSPGKIPYSSWNAKEWFKCFFGYLGDGNLYLFQFWFLRDLLVLTIISPVIKYILSRWSYAALFFFFALYICGVNIFICGVQSLFFYSVGFMQASGKINLFDISDRTEWKFSLFSYLLLWGLNCFAFRMSLVPTAFATLFSCILIIKFSKILISDEKTFKVLEKLSVFSFFLFAVHEPLLRMIVRTIWLKMLPMENGLLCLAEYFGVTFVIITAGTCLGALFKKICPPFFAILNGGRK